MLLSPQSHVTEEQRERGLRGVVVEAAFANAAGAMTSGVILIAFALHLGASNAVIGLLVALPFLGQLLQAPAIILVERTRARKRIAVISSIIGRSCLLGMAGLAFFPGTAALAGMIGLQGVFCACNAVGSCAWNGWLKDLAPEERLGRVFGRRTRYATAAALAAGLVAAFGLDRAPGGELGRQIAFALLYAVGAAGGLVSAAIVARIPEPTMPRGPAMKLGPLLTAPFRDVNFRRLITFLTSWQFAVNLATPFFTVFIVQQLGYSMLFAMTVSAVSQVANVAALNSWGLLTDRFTSKSVLAVSGPLYILCIASMVGASQIADENLRAAYLVGLHVVMGLAVAGVTLGSTAIVLKLSPKGSATAYMAGSALISSLAAGLAPVLGGMSADFFSARRLEVMLLWSNPQGQVALRPLSLSHWDFYFLIAAIIGLYAVHCLALVREEGEIARRKMIGEILTEGSRLARILYPVAGLRVGTAVPAGLIRDRRLQARLARRQAERGAPTSG